MELLFRVSLFLLTLIGKTFGDEIDKIYCKEDENVILPCSFNRTKIDRFDWKQDGKDVFLWTDGKISSSSQHEQFRGRVSHFPNELNSGNASISIKKAKVSDSGNYICKNIDSDKSHKIELTVACVLKDRNNDPEQECRACPKPTISIHKQENGGTQVECAVHGAFPEPKMELQNSANVTVKAENPKKSDGGYFDIILEAVVTKEDYYHCVVTQEKVCHKIYSQKTMVHIPSGHLNTITIVLIVLLFGLLGVVLYCAISNRRSRLSPGMQLEIDISNSPDPIREE